MDDHSAFLAEIKADLEQHYKRLQVITAERHNEFLYITVVFGPKYVYVAQYLLDKYADLKFVIFKGGYEEYVFSRDIIARMKK